jgi:hypothetical protein
MKYSILLISTVLILGSCSIEKMTKASVAAKARQFEQITFVELIKKYVEKGKLGPAEGIYAVTSVVTRSKKQLFSGEIKEKEVDRRENYAQVAIILDNSHNNREYIEIPIDRSNMSSYPVRGEFSTMADGNILVLKHFEPKGVVLTYSLTFDATHEVLEGVRTETKGGKTFNYKLTYVKLYPKSTVTQTLQIQR